MVLRHLCSSSPDLTLVDSLSRRRTTTSVRSLLPFPEGPCLTSYYPVSILLGLCNPLVTQDTRREGSRTSLETGLGLSGSLTRRRGESLRLRMHPEFCSILFVFYRGAKEPLDFTKVSVETRSITLLIPSLIFDN